MSDPTPTVIDWAVFRKKGAEHLRNLQGSLLPQDADKVIAIEVETGEYCLGRSSREAVDALRSRFPDRVAWVARVDGSPVLHLHGHSRR